MSGTSGEAPAPQEDPISPSTFVEHIRELGEKRDREDQERNRLLEEQILQGRAERAARRAERRRSMSPEKYSQSSTPRSSKSYTPPRSPPNDQQAIPESPASMDAHGDALQRLTGSEPDAQGDDSAPGAPGTPTRTNTLSWQQRRPTSTSSRSRPLSLIAAENSASRSPNATSEPTQPADDTASRTQIAQALGSRQTPDRAIGSPASRRSRADDSSSVLGASGERATSPPTESVRSSSHSRASSVRGSAVFSNRMSRDTSISGFSDLKSPLPTLDTQKFHPPEHDDAEHVPSELSMSPRIPPERTPSPTKGMGGFVQSAMMRRTDSVNKRWSIQSGSSITRQGSSAGNFGGPSTPKLEATPLAREDPIERPSSALSNATETESVRRPAFSQRHSRGKSVGAVSHLEDSRSGAASPASPNKRWSRSPTKSSWLESALSAKPESPKPKLRQEHQPSWMAEISKIKAQKASVDLGRDKPFTDAPATPTSRAFPRSEAMSRSESRGSTHGSHAQSPDLGQGPPEEITDREQHPAPELAEHTASAPKSKPASLSSPKMEAAKVSTASPTLESPSAKAEKPAVALKSPGLRGVSPPAPKSEDPAKPDFRSGLKHRQRQSESVKTGELEFQNVFGKLKKTNTEKFVAPDALKDNITRGKAGLNQTGGPAPRVRKDEFRESLVKQRQSIQLQAKENGGSHVRTGSLAKPAEPVPEALELRKKLGRTDSISKPSAEPTEPIKTPDPVPEVETESKPPISPAKEASPVEEAPASPPKPASPAKEAPASPPKPASPAKAPASPPKPTSPAKDAPASPPKPASPAKDEPAVPEALGKLKSLRERKFTESSKPEEKEPLSPAKAPGKLPGKLSDRFNIQPKPLEKKEPIIPGRAGLKPVGKLADRFNTAPKSPVETEAASPKFANKLPGKLADRFGAPASPTLPGAGDKADVAGKFSTRASGKLADRFNPALAAALARGPSPGARESVTAAPATIAVEPAAGSTKELTHITKGRARGPKRRAPKGSSALEAKPDSPEPARKSSIPATVPLVKEEDVLPSSPTKPKTEEKPVSPVLEPKEDKPASPVSEPKEDTVPEPKEDTPEPKDEKPTSPILESPESRPKPEAPSKSPELSRRVSGKLESPSEPPVPAKSPELTRRISAKIEQPSTPTEPSVPAKSPELAKRISAKFEQPSTPTEPPVPAKSPELTRRISAKFEQPSTPPAPASKSPDLSKRFSAKSEQRKSPPLGMSSPPKPSELSKKASGKFDSHQSTIELDLSVETKAESPKTESPKPASLKAESPKPASPKPASLKAESPKVESPKPASLKAESPKVESPKPASLKAESPKVESPKPASLKAESPKVESPKPASLKAESLKVESPKPESPKPESVKAESVKAESPKVESPKPASLKAESPKPASFKAESPKVESPKPESVKAESPKVESPKPASPKVESPKPASPAKPASLKAESPKIESPKVESPKVTSPVKPASLKAESLKAESPKIESPKVEPPIKPSSPPKADTGAKSDIAKRIAALKQGGDSSTSSQPGAPKPLFTGAARLNKENKSPTSPSPQTPVESPKPHKPLPQAPASEEAKPPTPAKDSVKGVAAMWSRQSASSPPKAKEPIKLPTKKDEQEAMENAGLVKPESPPAPIGLGIASLNDNKERPPPTPTFRISKELPEPPAKSPSPPPKPAKNDSISSPKVVQESPIPQQSEAGQLFADFFDDAPVTSGKLDIDAHAVLMGDPLGADRIKTARKEIHEISGDGKLSAVPAQEEHILFDNSMYLCTHVFGSSNGAKNTEVYFWTGSAVPEPTFEDAQLFARKSARDVGGKLIIIRQGKECPNFFQALGGILVTRKGTRTDHSKQYMLCGRQHLGHMAFDEVELSLNSLCSGFPFLISSRTGLLSGKIFLWKGKGCSAEELGCARLIGMDLGLTPEIEEIDEGQENATFLDIFPAPENGKEKKVPRSATHWQIKRNHPKYSVRLFRIDEKVVHAGGSFQVSSLWPVSFVRRVSQASIASSQGPSSPTESTAPQNNAAPAATGGPKPNMTAEVVEVAPFSQADLEAENIYVLDAFFEIYIIVGALSRNQSHAFATALTFAQEYGILAASLQDRPFIPVSTVVLEGVPRDMKAVFRHWEDQNQPTAALMAGRPRRGKSLRIVGLQAAIAATRENGATA